MTPGKNIGWLGNVVAAGWGDEVLPGLFAQFLIRANPKKLREYINNNTRIWETLSQPQQTIIRRTARAVDPKAIQSISLEKVLKILRKKAPNIAIELEFHPKGLEWLNSQILYIKNLVSQ
jgi:hypothetical protein